jgi:hypothetical protein
MPDWKTRLAVSYTPSGSTTPVDITPIDSFSPSFSLNAEVLHSIEQTHIGVVYNPESISFSLTVKTIGDVAANLTALALEGTRFDITLQESENGSDWSFSKIVLRECIITSATPTAASISGAPTATFSGFSLGASTEPKTGLAVEVPPYPATT